MSSSTTFIQRILSLFILLLFGFMITSCSSGTKEVTEKADKQIPTILDSLNDQLAAIHDTGQINGFGVAIVNDEKVLYAHGFGYADVKANKKYTANTIQNIASISKTFIGIALLKAQEMGKLNLDDPISKYLNFEVRNPYHPTEEITIRQLTNHTSSIVDGDVYDEQSYILKEEIKKENSSPINIPEEFNAPSKKTDMGVFLKKVLNEKGEWYSKDNFLKTPPGKTFDYTNVGATLAAYVLELATGEKYPEFTTKYILQPLKMNASGWSFDQIDFSKHTQLYARPDTLLPHYSLITYPDGGMLTSVNDMSLYLQELIKGYAGTGTLLSKESYEEYYRASLDDSHFTEERDKENPYNDEYSMGIFMGLSAMQYIGHTGGDPGVSTLMFFDKENKIGRLLFINTSIDDAKSWNEYITIWNTLGAYEDKL